MTTDYIKIPSKILTQMLKQYNTLTQCVLTNTWDAMSISMACVYQQL